MIVASCASKPTGLPKQASDRTERVKHGYLYYLDGAGGGTVDKNWAGGVREGFFDAGYPGAGEMFSWELGEGMMADQKASVKYKRKKAGQLADRIEKQVAAHPAAPVGLLGFSAGTAEVIFAMEDLPADVEIDTVVLLGASISHDYDLTEMLKRLKGKLYLYTSTHDRMVGFFMKFSGSTDRKYHDVGADIHGFVLPEGANAETRKLYADKIVTIKWNKKFEKDGDRGHHFDNIKMEFIRDQVAPLFMGKKVPGMP
ncbi:MAG: hypothetical protein QM496_04550 [Verrucomicrobiota bacterium]